MMHTAALQVRARRRRVVDMVVVFSPILVPAAIVVALLVAFLVLMVGYAFAEGFAEGCAALAALIGLPSIGLLWLSKVLQVFGGGPR